MQRSDGNKSSKTPKAKAGEEAGLKSGKTSALTSKAGRSVSVDTDGSKELELAQMDIEAGPILKASKGNKKPSPKEKSKKSKKDSKPNSSNATGPVQMIGTDPSPEKENDGHSSKPSVIVQSVASQRPIDPMALEIDVDGAGADIEPDFLDNANWTLIGHDLDGPIENTKFEQESQNTHLPNTERLSWGIEKPFVAFESEKSWIARLLKKGLKHLHAVSTEELEKTVDSILQRVIGKKVVVVLSSYSPLR